MKTNYKDKIIGQLKKREIVIRKKLTVFEDLNKELKEIHEAIKALGGEVIKQPIQDGTTLLHLNESNQTPLSDEGMKKLIMLSTEFTTEEVFTLLGNNKTEAYQWIAAWKRKGYIDTIARGNYRKTSIVPLS